MKPQCTVRSSCKAKNDSFCAVTEGSCLHFMFTPKHLILTFRHKLDSKFGFACFSKKKKGAKSLVQVQYS